MSCLMMSAVALPRWYLGTGRPVTTWPDYMDKRSHTWCRSNRDLIEFIFILVIWAEH